MTNIVDVLIVKLKPKGNYDVRETKPHLVLSLAMISKITGRASNRYAVSKRETKGNVGPPCKELQDLATLEKEKAEVLNYFCALVLNG